MKTRYMIAAASALLLLAGCAREMDIQTPGSSVLKAVIEQSETRVSFDEMGKFTWDEGDQIAVYVGGSRPRRARSESRAPVTAASMRSIPPASLRPPTLR